MLLFWLQRASIRRTRLLGRLFCTALLSCSWGGKQICLRVGKGGRGQQHLSHGLRTAESLLRVKPPCWHWSCTGQIKAGLPLARLLCTCCPSALTLAPSAKVTTSLPLAQYLSYWSIFCVVHCWDGIMRLGGQWSAPGCWLPTVALL